MPRELITLTKQEECEVSCEGPTDLGLMDNSSTLVALLVAKL